MKLFLARTVNLLLIGALLLGYQYQAGQRADAVADYQEQVKAAQAEQVQEGQAQTETGPYQDGVFTGKGTGFQGELTVQMTVEQGWITSLTVLETADDPEYVQKASALLDQIVETQDPNQVDAVSGATFSSKGMIDAVWDAIGE